MSEDDKSGWGALPVLSRQNKEEWFDNFRDLCEGGGKGHVLDSTKDGYTVIASMPEGKPNLVDCSMLQTEKESRVVNGQAMEFIIDVDKLAQWKKDEAFVNVRLRMKLSPVGNLYSVAKVPITTATT